jgi:uncharacterized protein (TIGR03663 family)
MQEQPSTPSWLERPLLGSHSRLTLETLLVIVILILTVASRFAMLGARVMSHDEVNHVVPSYDLYSGRGYAHSPVTHGPFQFHIVALSYFLLGDSDFSSRVPAALFSIAAVAFVLFAFRRYLGRSGALLAGLFFSISPYMLFYGRYTRNEGFIELLGALMLYAVLRHIEKGDKASLFLLTGALVMHFIVKETSFIYSAQLLLFLGIYFIMDLARAPFKRKDNYRFFLILVIVAILLVGVAIGVVSLQKMLAPEAAAAATTPGPEAPAAAGWDIWKILEVLCVFGAFILLVVSVIPVVRDLGWEQLRKMRTVTLLIVAGTLVLPQLTAFPIAVLGWDPLDYTSSAGLLRTGITLFLMLAISAAIGVLWNWRLWLSQAALFYAVFVFFYTTMFTNANGFFSGIIGSLGYWISQQSVNRGSQPWYFYAFLQLPIYEFLAVLGTLLAIYFAIRHRRFSTLPGVAPSAPEAVPAKMSIAETSAEIVSPSEALKEPDPIVVDRPLPVLWLLLFWSLTALIAYSIAGEKMPWLTVHIALPLLLSAGWGLGYLVDTTHWSHLANRRGAVALLLFPVFLSSLSAMLGSLLGATPPFSGSNLEQLTATNTFLFSLIASVASAGGIVYLLKDWSANQIVRLLTATFFVFMGVLTARAAYRASFINYDNATEFLVYAHAASGPKEVLRQVEEISRRTTGSKDIAVAYSDDALYPYWWYFRDYPYKRWFGKNPTRDLNTSPIIIAGEDVINRMEPIVGNDYVKFEYTRLWWPMQDYYGLDFQRIWEAISNPEMRAALWDIWLNRDYAEYARINGNANLTLSTWQPSARMDVYIRKDVVGEIWDYGAAPAIISEPTGDPYAEKLIDILADQTVGGPGADPGFFQAPRGIAVAQDGGFYVADSRNNRIQQFDGAGSSVQQWGSFADAAVGDAPGGTFNEPWDVAVGLDGSVYVTDTWNHRIQQFTAEGEFIRTWGYFGQAEAPEAFWGPRALAIDARGRVYVTDTGNKRVVIFEADGTYVAQFGTAGFDPGQFDEPVGLAIDADGLVYVADTWNQRVQVFQPDESGTLFTPIRQIDIAGWYGQSLDNKPFLKVSPINNHLFVTDPEGPRVLEFDPQGEFVRGWGQMSADLNGFGIASGVAVDAQGGVWVSDASNHRLMHFTLPE